MSEAWWSWTTDEAPKRLHSRPEGLAAGEAAARLKQSGPNRVDLHKEEPAWKLLLDQIKNPLVLMLVFASIVSMLSGEWLDAAIVLVIVAGSSVLSFYQEYRAGVAMARLRERLSLKAPVWRDGQLLSLPVEELVPGDVVQLGVGSLIPADGILLEARDFHVNEASLTGETLPVGKMPGISEVNSSLPDRTNAVFMGTDVRSGTATFLVCATGLQTSYGAIANRLTQTPPETDYERGLREFGQMLTQVMAVLIVGVLSVNVVLHKPVVESLLFAVALAVGLAPELLPAILALNLARGARDMAEKGVNVRRLSAIENFGAMEMLCTDKTGTLTKGVVRLDGAVDRTGQPSSSVFLYAWLNAHFETGLNNPLDEAILAGETPAHKGWEKRDEIPYDFVRRRLSVVVAREGRATLITKGALESVLSVCSQERQGAAIVPMGEGERQEVLRQLAEWSGKGFRILGVATREEADEARRWGMDDEKNLCFEGFLLFFDPPKEGVRESLDQLRRLGVELKVITGDHPLVARHLAGEVGLPVQGVLTGRELTGMSEEALGQVAERTTIFAQVDPNQKERIVRLLRKRGRVVGYMGDGINDAPALRAADVGISVDSAVDVAKEAADFVLLSPDLNVLQSAIVLGRTVFANTHKYILTTTSANLGNMLSMALSSMFLPFLPLLARQILLNNFLSDLPAFGLARDSVDPELIERPETWDQAGIRRFMFVFGAVSALFDGLTFLTLMWIFKAAPEEFRTGWFIESLLTELVVALSVRTRRFMWKSKVGTGLLVSTVVVVAVTLGLPYVPGMDTLMGFVPLPLPLLGALILITALYLLATEVTKFYFFRSSRRS